MTTLLILLLLLTPIFLLVGLILKAASAKESPELGITVAIGIFIHNVPEGIAISGKSRDIVTTTKTTNECLWWYECLTSMLAF
jgi:zinc transporter ZupT